MVRRQFGGDAAPPDPTRMFDTVEFRDAYRISYLTNAIVVPTYEAIRRDFGIIRAEYVLLLCLAHFPVLTAQWGFACSGRFPGGGSLN